MNNIAGLSLTGGKQDNFFFALLEYYEDSQRWFLKSLHQVKDEERSDGNLAITDWIIRYNLQEIIVDFPLSSPPCHTCKLLCPGMDLCEEPTVTDVRQRISSLVEIDHRHYEKNPKAYEMERIKLEEFDFNRDCLKKDADEPLLTKSFKRKLKKGFLPYWNRPLDFWVWTRYYDQLLHFFGMSFDSFGNTSLMLLARFQYLRRHFPPSLLMFESNIYLCLIELLRAKIIQKNQLLEWKGLDTSASARSSMIKSIEKNLNIFLYDHDSELLIKNHHAFDSFLLAVVGQCYRLKKTIPIPSWTQAKEAGFLVPQFISF